MFIQFGMQGKLVDTWREFEPPLIPWREATHLAPMEAADLVVDELVWLYRTDSLVLATYHFRTCCAAGLSR